MDFENPSEEETETEEERDAKGREEKMKVLVEFLKTGAAVNRLLNILDNPEELEKLKKMLESTLESAGFEKKEE